MRSGRLLALFCTTLVFCLPGWLPAQTSPTPVSTKESLHWERKETEVTSATNGEKVVARYAFQNVGDTPVTILTLSTSCTCTQAAVDKKLYAPQEKGEIVVTLTPTAKTAAVTTAQIMVETDAMDRPKTVLTLKTRASEAVFGSLEPSVLTWPAGEPLAPKTIKLQILKGGPGIKEVSVSSTDAKLVTAQVKVVRANEEYEITVTPGRDVKDSSQAKLIIRGDYTGGGAGRLLSVVNIH